MPGSIALLAIQESLLRTPVRITVLSAVRLEEALMTCLAWEALRSVSVLTESRLSDVSLLWADRPVTDVTSNADTRIAYLKKGFFIR